MIRRMTDLDRVEVALGIATRDPMARLATAAARAAEAADAVRAASNAERLCAGCVFSESESPDLADQRRTFYPEAVQAVRAHTCPAARAEGVCEWGDFVRGMFGRIAARRAALVEAAGGEADHAR